MSQTEIMTTVFPMFQQHIEPHLVHAHVSSFRVQEFCFVNINYKRIYMILQKQIYVFGETLPVANFWKC